MGIEEKKPNIDNMVNNLEKYLTPYAKEIYDKHKEEVKKLIKELNDNEENKRNHIESFKKLNEKDKYKLFNSEFFKQLGPDQAGGDFESYDSLDDNFGEIGQIGEIVGYFAAAALMVWAVANDYIGGSKHKKRKGRKTKKSMKHKKGRKSKKARKTMKKKKSMKKRKSMKKKKSMKKRR